MRMLLLCLRLVIILGPYTATMFFDYTPGNEQPQKSFSNLLIFQRPLVQWQTKTKCSSLPFSIILRPDSAAMSIYDTFRDIQT